MTSAIGFPEKQAEVTVQHADDYIAPAPRVSVQAFCESVTTALAVKAAAEDRRLGKAHLTEHHLVPPTLQEMKSPGIAKTRS